MWLAINFLEKEIETGTSEASTAFNLLRRVIWFRKSTSKERIKVAVLSGVCFTNPTIRKQSLVNNYRSGKTIEHILLHMLTNDHRYQSRWPNAERKATTNNRTPTSWQDSKKFPSLAWTHRSNSWYRRETFICKGKEYSNTPGSKTSAGYRWAEKMVKQGMPWPDAIRNQELQERNTQSRHLTKENQRTCIDKININRFNNSSNDEFKSEEQRPPMKQRIK